MRVSFTFILLFITVLLISNGLASDNDSLTQIDWILGDWIWDNENSITTESWKKVSPQTFEGFGQTEKKQTGKITNSETLRIVTLSGEIFYIAKVAHNKMPIPFKLVDSGSTSAIFENPDYDFPKKIKYMLLTDNRLKVLVSNEKRNFEIIFTRKDGK